MTRGDRDIAFAEIRESWHVLCAQSQFSMLRRLWRTQPLGVSQTVDVIPPPLGIPALSRLSLRTLYNADFGVLCLNLAFLR